MQTNTISTEKKIVKKRIRVRPKVKDGSVNNRELVELYANKYRNNLLSIGDCCWIKDNAALLESYGWSHCDVLNFCTPDEKTFVYPNYDSLLLGTPLRISGHGLKRYRHFDYDGNLYSLDCKTIALDESGQTITFPRGVHKVYKNLVSRHNTVYTTFKAEFHNHAGAKRNWKPPVGQTFGIEVEMKFPSVISKLLFARDVFSKYNGQWICERDGSLEDLGDAGDCGLELISPPLLYPDLQEQTAYLICLAKGYGAELPKDKIKKFYGIHVTTGTDRDLKIAAGMCALINHPELRNFWSNLAGRNVNEVYNPNTGHYYCRFDDFKSTSPDDIYYLAAANHYRATFIRGNYNVEARIFQTVFDTGIIALYIESMMLARNFVEKTKKTLDIRSGWRMFVEENGSYNFRKFTQSNI